VQLAAELEVAEGIWKSELQSRARSMQIATELLALDTGFGSSFALPEDAPDRRATLESALESLATRIGATVAAAVGQDLHTRASQPAEAGAAGPAMQQVAARFLADKTRAPVQMVGDEPFQFVAAPLRPQVGGGAVVMGFPLDAALLQVVSKKSRMHVAIVARGAGGAPVVGVSTLTAGQRQDLAGLTVIEPGRAMVGDESMLMHRVALGDGLPAQLWLLGSIDEAKAPYQEVQRDLVAITVAAMLLFALGSLYTARRITTPLRALLQGSRRIGRGDYSRQMLYTTRRDEIGRLAMSFDQMREDIATRVTEVRRLAYWDRLTDLPNRAQFREAVQTAIERAGPGSHVSVVMLDLDRFKPVNDVLGYAIGDRLLQAVAGRLAGQVLRHGDMVARLSGDEFALLLPDSDATMAMAVADRIAEVFELPLMLGEHMIDLRAGFGIGCWPEHAADADTLLSRAEVALYAAKHKATAMLVYSAALDSSSAQSLSLLSELKSALERDELRLFLQPKFASAGGALIGAEALVRWLHPTRGMVPPMQFIPFAEQTGFVRQLTLWIFEACVREWPALQALGLQRLSVNLSTRDLLDPELPEKLLAILQRHGAPAGAFCLEITESMIMEEPARAEATLNRLAAAGFKLSIDDYGTGHSSLSYVAGLPVHELKIDKSFVMDMDKNAKHATIVRSTIDLAHNLGLSVVAEGVETATVWALLASLQCDEGQGYHMSKPLPAQELPAFVARWRERQAQAHEQAAAALS
jgi:diguanylate cyclase (GGDEF)-like protein